MSVTLTTICTFGEALLAMSLISNAKLTATLKITNAVIMMVALLAPMKFVSIDKMIGKVFLWSNKVVLMAKVSAANQY